MTFAFNKIKKRKNNLFCVKKIDIYLSFHYYLLLELSLANRTYEYLICRRIMKFQMEKCCDQIVYDLETSASVQMPYLNTYNNNTNGAVR